MARDIALIVKPSSGRGKAGRSLESIRDHLASLGAAVEVLTSRSAAHATELASEASRRHPVVAAMGGDGMIALVANGLLGTEATLGVVPSGSGNDFASALGFARRRPAEACAVLAYGRTRIIDGGRIEDGPLPTATNIPSNSRAVPSSSTRNPTGRNRRSVASTATT